MHPYFYGVLFLPSGKWAVEVPVAKEISRFPEIVSGKPGSYMKLDQNLYRVNEYLLEFYTLLCSKVIAEMSSAKLYYFLAHFYPL